MRKQNILLASLLLALYGCQPETPVQQPAAPQAPVAMQEPVATEHAGHDEHAGHAGQSAASGAEGVAPVQQAAPVAAAKPAPAAPAAGPESKAEPVVSEADAMQLAKKSNCLACHAIGKKVVGPSWKDVAAKYRGDAGAEARMMEKIARGGSGVWGVMVMPPSPQVSEADRKTLARFVLSLQ